MKFFTFYSPKKIIPAFTAGWVIFAGMQCVSLHRMGLPWSIALQDGFISAGLLGIACCLALALYHFYQPGKSNRSYRFAYALCITLLYCVGTRWILKFIYKEEHGLAHFLDASMPVRFIISFLILAFVTLLNWLWHNLQEQKGREQRMLEAEQLVKDAELDKLRQQLQPHFLFNSLNSISALAGSKPQEARKMIQQLSDFLRGTLRKDEQKTVALNEELDHLRLYLEIEKVRFGHRLNVEMQSSDQSLTGHLPPLLLQPIVENAIKFGLYDTIGTVTISVATAMENQLLTVVIKNPFDPATQNANQGTGFGLNFIQRRLFLLYGRNDLLTTEKRETLFITTLKIPQ